MKERSKTMYQRYVSNARTVIWMKSPVQLAAAPLIALAMTLTAGVAIADADSAESKVAQCKR
jgi:hypothetical protein